MAGPPQQEATTAAEQSTIAKHRPGLSRQRPRWTCRSLGGGDGALGVLELNYLDDHTKAAVGYWRFMGRFELISALASEAERAGRRGDDGLYPFVERRLTRERADEAQGSAAGCAWAPQRRS